MQYNHSPLEPIRNTQVARQLLNEYYQNIDEPTDREVEEEYLAKLEKAHRMLQQLTPRQREVFLLRVVGGLRQKEIAKRLKIKQQVVSVHYRKAVKSLKKML